MSVYIIEQLVLRDDVWESEIKYVTTNQAISEQLKVKAEQEMNDQFKDYPFRKDELSINVQIWDTTDSMEVDEKYHKAMRTHLEIVHEYPKFVSGSFRTFYFIDDLSLDDPDDKRYVVRCIVGIQNDAENYKSELIYYIDKETLEITD